MLESYEQGFLDYVRTQGYIHLDLTCYRVEVREGWVSNISYEDLFKELFE